MSDSEKNWLDSLIPFPRPEYAKQTEALLTDLLWRSEGSSLSQGAVLEQLASLRPAGTTTSSAADPERLIFRKRDLGSNRLFETYPLAESADLTSVWGSLPAVPPNRALLYSVLAPRARGDKSDACVPIHPSLVSLQTLHGLVNKENPANIATAIETMGWLGGAPAKGSVASLFLSSYSVSADPRSGLTGLIENVYSRVASQVWARLPSSFGADGSSWASWPGIVAVSPTSVTNAAFASYGRTPFSWFWKKWTILCDPQNGWKQNLPTRRFVDWAMCLLRTGLAFSYLWEAEFFCRLHECVLDRIESNRNLTSVDRISSLLIEGAVLGGFEPSSVPFSEKGIWPATSELLARGYEARKRIYDVIDGDKNAPTCGTLPEILVSYINSLSSEQLEKFAAPLQTHPRTANNQKEFVRYLLLPRSSDDDLVDQADFYYLARTNSRHVWFYPGPEWLVVLTSLLGRAPGGFCTLGMVVEDLAAVGIRAERSVLVALLEDAGLTTDSPDADNALVIRSGF
jgi:hypothetical protein